MSASVWLLAALFVIVMAGEDYYKILEVQKDATADEIKKSFRKLARNWHPDRNKNEDTTEKFKQITNAYEILSDPEKRAIYDQYGEEGLSGGGGGAGGGGRFGRGHGGGFQFSDPSEIFRQFFGGQGGGFGGQHSFTRSSGGFGGFGGGFGGDHPGFGGGGGRRFQQESSPGPVFGPDSKVVQLTVSNWDESIRKDQDVALVMFYSPRIHSSHTLKDAFEKVVGQIKDTAIVGAVNCDEEGSMCRKYGATSELPAVKLFGYRMHSRPESVSDRKAKTLYRAISDAIPSFVTKLDQQSWFVFKGEVHVRPRVILLTKNPDHTSNLIRALSTEFRGSAGFGQGDIQSSLFTSEFKVLPNDLNPKLIFQTVAPSGDVKSFLYKGKMEFKPMKKFIAKLLKRHKIQEKPSESKSSQVLSFTSKSSLKQSGINVLLCLNSVSDQKKWSAFLDRLATTYKNDPIHILWSPLSASDLKPFKLKGDTWLVWNARKDKFATKPADEAKDFNSVSSWIDRALGGDLRLSPISDLFTRDEL